MSLNPFVNTVEAQASSAGLNTAYAMFLPQVISSDPILQDTPIWAHGQVPAAHEVVLFRTNFPLNQALTDARLVIFADTRYEAWVDGVWVGRGPARFSSSLREVDSLALGNLAPGRHWIAVMVQWAPNYRRSESVGPYLQAHVEGVTPEGRSITARTGSSWKVWQTDAWEAQAAPVHAWGLIGPTEILDLGRLPRDWMLPGYADANWKAALTLPPRGTNCSSDQSRCTVSLVLPGGAAVETFYAPRSIAALRQYQIFASVIDQGVLSPGRTILEFPAGQSGNLSFGVTFPGLLSLEVLTGTYTVAPSTILLDGRPLTWVEAGPTRPGVVRASRYITNWGQHQINLTQAGERGISLSLSTTNLSISAPFKAGLEPGRRLLLAEPVTMASAVNVQTGTAGLNLTFRESPAYVVLDLGRTVHGRLRADVSGPAGAVVDIGWDERLYPGTLRPLPFPGALHPEWNQVDAWTLDGTARPITTIDTRAGRYVYIAVWGGAGVRLSNVQVEEERYPVTLYGRFDSTNERLDQIWQVGVESLYPNMTDGYTDTPWRERGQWWGDAYVAYQANEVSFGDERLWARGLVYMTEAYVPGLAPAAAPNSNGMNVMDYAMLWVQGLAEGYVHSGDTAFLQRAYPNVRLFMDQLASYENSETGLLDLPLQHWSLTMYIDPTAYASRYGQSAAANALYYGTLLDAVEIAAAVGDSGSANLWRARAERVKVSLNSVLYDPVQHRYQTNLYQGDVFPPTIHAQAWPLAYGLVPEGERRYVAQAVLELLGSDPANPTVGVYGMHWVLEGLGQAQFVPEALSLIESIYGRMLDLGATTWWEGFNAHTSYSGSLSHSWGSSPTYFLSRYVLGAREVAPDQWEVQPALGSVEAVSGLLPLHTGVLQVAWRSVSCEQSQIEVVSPPGASGEIVIPSYTGLTTLALNGETIMSAGNSQVEWIYNQSDGYHISVGEGSFTLLAQHTCETR